MVPRSTTANGKAKSDEGRGVDVAPHHPSDMNLHSLPPVERFKEGVTSDLSPHSLTSQKEMWKLEQQVVGALVRVEPDPPQDNSFIKENSIFHVALENQNDVFSFSTKPELYGGTDVSFPASDDDEAVAVYVVIDQRTMKVVFQSHSYFTLNVPYIPGFLAFREIFPLEHLVLQQIQNYPQFTPKAILVDGNGILHPRHAGIACFLGTRTDIPTIGIGKSLLHVAGWTRDLVDEKLFQFVRDVHHLIGFCSPSLAETLTRHRGSIIQKTTNTVRSIYDDGTGDTDMKPPASPHDLSQALQDLAAYCNGLAIPLVNDESRKGPDDETDSRRFPVLGCALVGHGGQIAATARSQPRAGSSKPIFVSVGHRISLQEAVQIAASLSMHRIPEPVRQADLYGREMMRQREALRSRERGAATLQGVQPLPTASVRDAVNVATGPSL